MNGAVNSVIKRVLSLNRKQARTYFDAKFYRTTYADVAKVGVDPFQHFMNHGWREGRNPSAEFNTLYYRDRHLDGADLNPLSHYVDVGLAMGLSPRPASDEDFLAVQRPLAAPFFEPNYYTMQTGRLMDDPLTHHLSIGWRQGKSPNAHFDPTRYVTEHSFLKSMAVAPIYHFASQRRLADNKGRRPVSLATVDVSPREMRAVIETEFDRTYYLRNNRDVAKTHFDALSHYIDHGGREGRNPNALFNGNYYLAANTDVADGGMHPFYHYLTHGRAEGRRGNPVGVRVYPRLEAPAWSAWDAVAPAAATEGADVVVIMPVYKGYDETLASIYAVLVARQTTRFALHVIDDMSPDEALVSALEVLARRGLFSHERNEANLGFVKSVNRGLRRFARQEIVLLNSDAEVYGDWLDRLLRHAAGDPTIATITPLSNNATICSYPVSNQDNIVEPECSARELDAMAAVCNASRASDIPTGVGFCFYMSRASRDAVGILDEKTFGRGYGEENDFCLRASKAGFRNVLAEDIFVYHAGQVSFADIAAETYEPAQAALRGKHPDYPQLVRQYLAADPGEVGRMRLDLYRLAKFAGPGAMVFVSHALKGGIPRHAGQLEASLAAEGIAVVHVKVAVADRWSLEISSGAKTAPFCPNLRPMAFCQLKPLLVEFLDWLTPRGIHVHSLVGLDWAATSGVLDLIRASKIPYYFTLHDYSVVCHRNDLVTPAGRYCGLPEVSVCRACVASDRSYPEGIEPDVRRQTFAAFLSGATAVFAPSHDVKARLHRAGAMYPITVRPHTDRGATIVPAPRPLPNRTVLDIVAIGALGTHKGSRVILNLARDAQARGLPIRFHVVGYSDVTEEMTAAGVTETGRYAEDPEALNLVRAIRPAGILLPSIWPETFCYTLSMAFELHVPPVVFDLGAQCERVLATGFGFVLPYALIEDVKTMNDRLLALPYATATRSVVKETGPGLRTGYDAYYRNL